MSIKSDRWIKKMALEHRMIEPFEEISVAGFADHAKQFFRDRRLAEVGSVARPILEGIAEEYLTSDFRGDIFHAPDA